MWWPKFLQQLPELDQLLASPINFTYGEIKAKSFAVGPQIHHFFEGNNLHTLQYFVEQEPQPDFDLIVVDPPYNSHNDVVINDFQPNSPAIWYSGCSHAQWAAMLYLRLKLCQKLLNPHTGVVQLFCDDKEFASMRMLADHVFGESHFLGTYIWKSLASPKWGVAFSNNHTYILVYANSPPIWRDTKRLLGKEGDPGSILDQFQDSIAARNELASQLAPEFPPELTRFLNPKPADLLEYLLDTWTKGLENQVLDLFAGTGSLLIAAILRSQQVPKKYSVWACQYPFELLSYFRGGRPHRPSLTDKTLVDIARLRLQREIGVRGLLGVVTISHWRKKLKPIERQGE